jgi:serine/threonine protein kinase
LRQALLQGCNQIDNIAAGRFGRRRLAFLSFRLFFDQLFHVLGIGVVIFGIEFCRHALDQLQGKIDFVGSSIIFSVSGSVFYYGTRKSDGQCFYAMELVEGETLEAHLRHSGPLSPALALEVIAQVARALLAAEALGLVHRDLKPANLMLVEGPELTVKVIDFGLAKAVATDGSESDITHGGFVGTPAFASPERFTGPSADVRSDLYSLGITLWEMLTGQTPFRGDYAQIMYQHQHAPLPIGQLEGVPQPVVVLVTMLLEKDPERRFQNPSDLLKAMPALKAAIETGRTFTRQGLQKGLPALRGPLPTGGPHDGDRRKSPSPDCPLPEAMFLAERRISLFWTMHGQIRM